MRNDFSNMEISPTQYREKEQDSETRPLKTCSQHRTV